MASATGGRVLNTVSEASRSWTSGLHTSSSPLCLGLGISKVSVSKQGLYKSSLLPTTARSQSFRLLKDITRHQVRAFTMSTSLAKTSPPSDTPKSEAFLNQRPSSEAIPYRGPPLPNVAEDLIVPSILPTPLPPFSTSETDERLWVPQAPGIHFRPLIFSVSQGYFVNLLRVRRSGVLSRHRHTGPVHAVTLKGRWHYLEHAWWAEEGGYSYEPSGDVHTLEVPDGVDEMITLFHVTGAYVYVDPDGKPLGVEDVFSKLQSAREHYEKVGLGAVYVDQFIR